MNLEKTGRKNSKNVIKCFLSFHLRRVRPSLDIYDESLISRSRDPTPVVQEQFYMCEVSISIHTSEM